MLVKKKPSIKTLDRNDSTIILRSFYKYKNLCPCSICILRDHDHLVRYGEDGCGFKHMYKSTWTGTAYDNICRAFDTDRFYYIMRNIVKKDAD